MRVTRHAIESAVLHIFRDHRVFHSGGSLLLTDVHRAWRRTGLRTRDLDQGIEWLTAEKALRRAHYFRRTRSGKRLAEGDDILLLMDEGARRIGDVPLRVTALWREIHTSLVLKEVARRTRYGFWYKFRCRLYGFSSGLDLDPRDAPGAMQA